MPATGVRWPVADPLRLDGSPKVLERWRRTNKEQRLSHQSERNYSALTPLNGERDQPHAGTLVVEDDDGISASRERVGERNTTGVRVGAMLALAALALVGVAVVTVEPPRTLIDQPPDGRSSTFSRNDSGTSLPSEAETWGEIWSQASGAAVLRPTWLPKSSDEYQVHSELGIPRDGFFRYSVAYVELHSVAGRTVWDVEFVAESLDGPSRGFQQFGGAAQELKIRGRVAELFGNGSPGWTLAWIEGNYRYAIQAFGVSREDLLRITESVAPVIDDAGRTTPAPRS